MFKGGRPAHPIWEYFLRVTVDGKVHAKCKICGHQQAPRAEIMRSHYSLCAKLHNQDTDSDTVPSNNITQKRPRSPSPDSHPQKKHIVSSQSDISSHITKTSGTAKSVLDIEITKMFFACNILFSMTEHPQFCRVIQLSNQATHHQVVKPSVEYCWTMCMTNSHRI